MLAKPPAFRIALTIFPLPFNKRRVVVHGAKDFTLFFDDIETVQAYVDRCLRDKKIHEKTEED